MENSQISNDDTSTRTSDDSDFVTVIEMEKGSTDVPYSKRKKQEETDTKEKYINEWVEQGLKSLGNEKDDFVEELPKNTSDFYTIFEVLQEMDLDYDNEEVPVVEKEVEEVDAVKKVESADKSVTENGAAEDETKENGDSVKETADATDAVTADDVKDEESAPSTDEEQNGDKKAEAEAEETNGDSTDAPAEAVKRKVAASADAKSDETAATPEKKAKLDETKEDVTNGSDATEVAA